MTGQVANESRISRNEDGKGVAEQGWWCVLSGQWTENVVVVVVVVVMWTRG